jgi:hypothetical protein
MNLEIQHLEKKEDALIRTLREEEATSTST